MNKILNSILLVALFALAGTAKADPGCQNAEVIGPKLFTDICWSCIFPIRVAGATMSGGGGSYPSDAVG
ncbi:conjugal transfer protein TraU, partial [Vibrio parahaemolyticus]|nr:conjugal transfer protein TraU [Vibrio parahaemolyticus]